MTTRPDRPGRPSNASQQGEFEAARRWVEEFPPEAERNPIYDRLFAPASLSWHRLRVLDVGAGPISIFENVAPASADVVAYDTLAERYNTLTPNKKFPIVSALPDRQFTLISILNCLDHMDEPRELLDHVAPRLASDGAVWIYCNVDQPFDPTLHPQDFRFWQLVLLVGRYFDIERCGLVREGPLFPYGWLAICGARRRTPPARALAGIRFTLRCAAQYGWFGAVRAAVKALKLIGGRRLLPPELRF